MAVSPALWQEFLAFCSTRLIVDGSGPVPLLTPRETEILILVGEGRTNREISRELFIAERTVKNHLTSLFGKLRVPGRTLAAVVAVKSGLVEIDRQAKAGR